MGTSQSPTGRKLVKCKWFFKIEFDPQTYEEASEDPRYQKTMKEEYYSLQKNETWELVNLPPGRKLVKCKWVFKTKFVADGSLKYKAKLVAKGFSQVQGIDYNETFVPVEKMDSIRLVLSIAASKQWEVHHMDVKSSFIHGDIKEYIYIYIYMKYP